MSAGIGDRAEQSQSMAVPPLLSMRDLVACCDSQEVHVLEKADLWWEGAAQALCIVTDGMCVHACRQPQQTRLRSSG